MRGVPARVVSVASSSRGENSYSYDVDALLGVATSDRFTFHVHQFLSGPSAGDRSLDELRTWLHGARLLSTAQIAEHGWANGSATALGQFIRAPAAASPSGVHAAAAVTAASRRFSRPESSDAEIQAWRHARRGALLAGAVTPVAAPGLDCDSAVFTGDGPSGLALLWPAVIVVGVALLAIVRRTRAKTRARSKPQIS